MPANSELKVEQMNRLFDLLTLKIENKDIEIKELDKMISRAKAAMSQEDVAWVEKNLAEIYK